MTRLECRDALLCGSILFFNTQDRQILIVSLFVLFCFFFVLNNNSQENCEHTSLVDLNSPPFQTKKKKNSNQIDTKEPKIVWHCDVGRGRAEVSVMDFPCRSFPPLPV